MHSVVLVIVNLCANASQLNLCATKVKPFSADLFLDFVCLVKQLLVEVLALDPDQRLHRLADQLAVGLELLRLQPQLLVPVAADLKKCADLVKTNLARADSATERSRTTSHVVRGKPVSCKHHHVHVFLMERELKMLPNGLMVFFGKTQIVKQQKGGVGWLRHIECRNKI